MKIRKKFLGLTRHTYPYGTEKFLESFLPDGYKTDNFGNHYLSVGSDYTTMFTCHLDTSCGEMNSVRHKYFGDFIITDGTTILGADDKAGMIVVLYMIEKKIPGLYYFFIGEEVGCIGSSELSDALEKGGVVPEELKSIKKVVSFDRRGTTSVITDQFYGRCCSDEFANALCKELNMSGKMKMKPDDTGILTDSAQFMSQISECTNISVGYYEEHTVMERQNIAFLYELCKAVVKVDWESLPIKRDPTEITSKFHQDSYAGWGDWDSYDDDFGIMDRSSKLKEDFSDFSNNLYTFVRQNDIRKKAFISQTWINHEKLLILEMFKKQGRNIDSVDWDGTSLWITEDGSTIKDYIGNRSDLVGLIRDIDVIPVGHLKYDLVFVS